MAAAARVGDPEDDGRRAQGLASRAVVASMSDDAGGGPAGSRAPRRTSRRSTRPAATGSPSTAPTRSRCPARPTACRRDAARGRPRRRDRPRRPCSSPRGAAWPVLVVGRSRSRRRARRDGGDVRQRGVDDDRRRPARVPSTIGDRRPGLDGTAEDDQTCTARRRDRPTPFGDTRSPTLDDDEFATATRTTTIRADTSTTPYDDRTTSRRRRARRRRTSPPLHDAAARRRRRARPHPAARPPRPAATTTRRRHDHAATTTDDRPRRRRADHDDDGHDAPTTTTPTTTTTPAVRAGSGGRRGCRCRVRDAVRLWAAGGRCSPRSATAHAFRSTDGRTPLGRRSPAPARRSVVRRRARRRQRAGSARRPACSRSTDGAPRSASSATSTSLSARVGPTAPTMLAVSGGDRRSAASTARRRWAPIDLPSPGAVPGDVLSVDDASALVGTDAGVLAERRQRARCDAVARRRRGVVGEPVPTATRASWLPADRRRRRRGARTTAPVDGDAGAGAIAADGDVAGRRVRTPATGATGATAKLDRLRRRRRTWTAVEPTSRRTGPTGSSRRQGDGDLVDRRLRVGDPAAPTPCCACRRVIPEPARRRIAAIGSAHGSTSRNDRPAPRRRLGVAARQGGDPGQRRRQDRRRRAAVRARARLRADRPPAARERPPRRARHHLPRRARPGEDAHDPLAHRPARRVDADHRRQRDQRRPVRTRSPATPATSSPSTARTRRSRGSTATTASARSWPRRTRRSPTSSARSTRSRSPRAATCPTS